VFLFSVAKISKIICTSISGFTDLCTYDGYLFIILGSYSTDVRSDTAAVKCNAAGYCHCFVHFNSVDSVVGMS